MSLKTERFVFTVVIAAALVLALSARPAAAQCSQGQQNRARSQSATSQLALGSQSPLSLTGLQSGLPGTQSLSSSQLAALQQYALQQQYAQQQYAMLRQQQAALA